MDAMQRLRFTHLDPACKSCTCRQIAYNPCVSLKNKKIGTGWVVEQQRTSIWSKFFSAVRHFSSDKANSMLAVDFCTCLFIKQSNMLKDSDHPRVPELNLHNTTQPQLSWMASGSTRFFPSITPNWFVLIVQTTCIQYQARAVINFSWWEVQWATPFLEVPLCWTLYE